MRPIKNKKRRDPRYFLHEQSEEDEQRARDLSTQHGKAGKTIRHGDRAEDITKMLFKALDGPGTDEDTVLHIIDQLELNPETLAVVYATWNSIVPDGTLVQWLVDDGMQDAADRVTRALQKLG